MLLAVTHALTTSMDSELQILFCRQIIEILMSINGSKITLSFRVTRGSAIAALLTLPNRRLSYNIPRTEI